MLAKFKAFAKKFWICRKLWHLYILFIYWVKSPLKPYNKKNRKGAVVQLITSYSHHDAIGNSVYEISKELTRKGITNYIVYEGTNVKSENAIPIHFFNFNKRDVVIYHMSIGCPASNVYKKCNVKKKIMFYHNITPSKYFPDNKYARKLCNLGREQLIDLKNCTNLAICVSKFNENELKRIGYKNTCVIPIPHQVNNLLKCRSLVNFLTVGRIAYHKCIEDDIKIFYEFHKINKLSRLDIVGNISSNRYFEKLIKLINKLDIKNYVNFYFNVNTQSLASFYSNATIYLCSSEHEGFCVPLIEAMAFKIPIFAYDSTAISETLGGAGFLFAKKDYKSIAKQISAILNNKKIVKKIKEDEYKRYLQFNNQKSLRNICEILRGDKDARNYF